MKTNREPSTYYYGRYPWNGSANNPPDDLVGIIAQTSTQAEEYVATRLNPPLGHEKFYSRIDASRLMDYLTHQAGGTVLSTRVTIIEAQS